MACRISRGLLEKCGTSMGVIKKNYCRISRGVYSFFLSEFPSGVTHFSRISGQDVTTFFLGIPCSMGKIHKLEIPEGVFKKTRPQPPY